MECEVEEEVVESTEVSMALTKVENGNLKDKVGMIKRKCSVCCILLGVQVNNSQQCSSVS